MIGCSPQGLTQLQNLEWHTNLVPDTLRVRRMDAGNWIRISIQNDSDIEAKKWIVFFSTNIMKLESCFYDSEGKYEQNIYTHPKEIDFSEISHAGFPHFPIRLNPRETRTFYYFLDSSEDMTYANFPVKLLDTTSFHQLNNLYPEMVFLLSSIVLLFLFLSFGYWLKTRQILFPILSLFAFVLSISFFVLHVTPLSLLIDWQEREFKFPYFLFQTVSYLILFAFLHYVKRLWEPVLAIRKRFLLASAFGLIFLFVPISKSIFEYRIIVLGLATGLSTYYFLKSHKLLFQFRNPVTIVYLACWAIFLILNLAKNLYHFDFYPYNTLSIFSFVLFTPFHFIIVGYCLYTMSKRNFFIDSSQRNSVRKSTLGSLEIGGLVDRIHRMLEEDKVYLRSPLREEILARELGIGLHQFSEIINVEFKTNFPSLINQYRIATAKRLLIEFPKMSIAEVRVRSGFSSKSAFNLEFKKVMGMSPNQFRGKIRTSVLVSKESSQRE
ncbi:helix-turn-helix domain-containing protein [Leptospira licerasiae]|uniref:DNA-binding helix-turn-helix protein n=1 Tax=Leptospira licerasiae str. MMD4847 TaxID=1049971 RepID=A0ABP2RDP2_9LEPT|nr:helix-turn-helix domain-containing protein [Leptospira licerasiae]EID99576.1 DNA-binding helix-turn-helix protein [Leptospira licerasiae serovar Varillal str. VAR 010]EJZ41645.1 DNA-binding helix-turn-helix protein [Leptospira licerasiae str. MMD4847]